MLWLALTPLLLVAVVVQAAHHAIPEDIFAFPSYSIAFLNALPIDTSTAREWLDNGISGGLHQFLGLAIDPPVSPQPAHDLLQFIRMGHNNAYLCYLPPPPPPPPPAPFTDDPQLPVPASKSWQLLSALAGKCLYHRQGWFTYSYCHNLHVRQFRELAHSQPLPGSQVPEEDNEWESFTLGRSPTADLSNDLVATDDAALAQNLEVARGARQRYLVQRWADGTVCDKTGRRREIEVQFHCSTTITDSIMFVKETSTCKYVLVIHTPRLCGEPGFKSRAEHTEEAPIRCREILDDDAAALSTDRSLVESPHPRRRPTQQQQQQQQQQQTLADSPTSKQKEKDTSDEKLSVIKKIFEALVTGGSKVDAEVSVLTMEESEDGQGYWVLDSEDGADLLAKLTESSDESQQEDPQSDRDHNDL